MSKHSQATKMQAIKGMKDLTPAEASRWQVIEQGLSEVLRSFAYQEIRMPIVEFTSVFARSIGDVTDIVQKEMYTFEDRNGDSLTLRPEGTASCVRAVLEHNLLHQQAQRLWYMGPMFRHERPQKGRYRQFHQLGVECLGLEGPDIDAELIMMTADFWSRFELAGLRLELNSLGGRTDRAKYRDVLTAYFNDHRDSLDADSLQRLEKNPLRILDSKNPELKILIEQAPKLLESLSNESTEHFAGLKAHLDQNKIDYEVNPKLVRGLDYYTNTVFEWITDDLGAQGTVCAGGRYDGLVELMGGKSTPAVGFAMGLERFQELVRLQESDALRREAELYVLGTDERFASYALSLCQSLRSEFPEWRVLMHCGGGSMKSQMKKANKSGALAAIIVGTDEINQNQVTIKPLRDEIDQLTVARSAAADSIRRLGLA